MNHTLYLMLGYPGSGKSHFSKRLAEKINAIRLNSDHLRKHLFETPETHHGPEDHLIVFGALAYAVHEVLKAGHSVVCDANYNFLKYRRRYAEMANALNAQTVIIWIKTSLDTAVERGAVREHTNEQVQFDAQHIKRVAGELEPPLQTGEMYVEIDGTLPFDDQIAQFNEAFNLQETKNTASDDGALSFAIV